MTNSHFHFLIIVKSPTSLVCFRDDNNWVDGPDLCGTIAINRIRR